MRLAIDEQSESEESEQTEFNVEIQTVQMKESNDSNDNCILSKIEARAASTGVCGGACQDNSIILKGNENDASQSKPFSPYDSIKAASKITTELNDIINNSMGVEVKYFKTSPDTRSSDYILNEYSLINVVSEKCVKIMFPNQTLPSTDISFNPLMMDYPTMFTVHILKKHFREIFGSKSHPDIGDYIYVNTMFHNMYEINSIIDDTKHEELSTFWIISLKQFEKRAERQYDKTDDGESLLEDTLDVITGIEEEYEKDGGAGIEMEKANHTIQEQVSVQTPYSFDDLRKSVDKYVKIVKYDLRDKMAIISRNHYDLSDSQNQDSVVYNDLIDFSSIENDRMISLLFKVNDTNTKDILKISNNEKTFKLSVSNSKIVVSINGKTNSFQNISENTWYAMVYMQRNMMSQVCLYELQKLNAMNNVLVFKSTKSANISQYEMKDATVSVQKFNGQLTNLRIWNKMVKVEDLMLLIEQYVVKDSQLLLLADNAMDVEKAPQVY